MEASCLELALEGERLCKAGDFKGGVAFFEAAVQVGTEDLKTLSAIYSQLGNAYFYLKEYSKALEYHKHDLTLARTIGDRIGEAKASGNLGNTLKILGQFDEAVVCCQRHLDISQEQGDKVGEARALYNIGNVYHAKGKHLSWNMAPDPGYLPQEVKETLQKASEYYERNLSLVKELGDRAAQGRAYGNLGNTQYLLGNFSEAIAFHKERLAIAKEFGDKAAERRAYSNLGNAHIFLGRFDISAEYYKKTLQLSRQLKDQAVEAQACYSLGNTYTLLQDYERAIDYHLKHLVIAQELGDRVGEGRACWSLGNAYVSLGSHEQALRFARKHLEISQEVRETGSGQRELVHQTLLNEIRKRQSLGPGKTQVGLAGPRLGHQAPCLAGARPKRSQRSSMDSLDLLQFPSEKAFPLEQRLQQPFPGAERRCPGSSASPLDASEVRVQVSPAKISRSPSDEECFFDLLSKFQSNRMDDQRCPLEESAAEAAATPVPALEERITQPSLVASPQTEEFFDLIASSQSRRLDDQRASVGNLPGLRITHNNLGHLRVEGDAQEPGDEFFNMLMKCQHQLLEMLD
ncbi:PREDICTED: G-protein-signaling modulator 1 [Tinamus guttatus]|uniref:G-protein-signaling modulator 1 n=1 Tax=Tinamus guttatus TaxID=94827 RepID=UPI00052F1396|nr:PREDICTED: G-protein-signaling modulator 1 [Tinamus guttatus]